MSRIHLKRLEIRELFERSFDLKLEDLGEGVTVVYGPNASGKSSLATAAARVFCTKLTLPTDHIRASLSFGETLADIELRSPRGANPAPQSTRPWLYTLSIPDLVAGPSTEDTQLISETLAGGLDLAKCLPTKGGRAQDLDGPRTEMDKRRARAGEVARDEASLERLEAERDEAERAARDLRIVQNWIASREADIEAGSIEARAKTIQIENPGIELQQPNATEDLREALRLLAEAELAAGQAQTALLPFEGRRPISPLTADDRSELARLTTDSIKRRESIDGVDRWIRSIKAQIDELEPSLGELGSAPLPIDAGVQQRLAEAVATISAAKEVLGQAQTAERESKEACRLALQTLEDLGGDADTALSVRFDAFQIAEAGRLDEVVRLAREAVAKAESALTEAKSRMAHAEADLPKIKDGIGAEDVMAQLRKEPSVSELADRARRAQVESIARENISRDLEEKLSGLRQTSGEADRAVRALVDWIKAAPTTGSPKRPIGIVITAVLFGLMAIAETLAGVPTVGAIVGALGLGVVAVLLWLPSTSAPSAGNQRDFEVQVPESWRPDGWTVSAVAVKLDEAVTAAKSVQVTEKLLDDAKAAARTLDPTGVNRELESRLRELQESTGFDYTYPYEMALLVTRLGALRLASDEVAARLDAVETATTNFDAAVSARQGFFESCNAKVQTGDAFKALATACTRFREAKQRLDQKGSERKEALDNLEKAEQGLRELLSRFNWPCEGDPETARTLFLEWIATSEKLSKLRHQLDEQSREKDRLSGEEAEAAQRVCGLFALYGHPAPASPIEGIDVFLRWFETAENAKETEESVVRHSKSIAARLRRNGVPDEGDFESQCGVLAIREPESRRYRQLCAEVAEKRSEARLLKREEDEPVIRRYFNRSTPGLEQLQDLQMRLAKNADKAASLSEQVNKIKAEINLATQETGLVTAQKNLDAAIAKSLDWLALIAKNAANRAVLAAIERSTREENTTPVIESANRWLERLTEGRYGDLTEDNKTVCVRDRDNSGRVQKTEELSTGTKVHLALSIRLAVIEQSETHGQQFPLFLDEVMATSDPQARMAIANALKEISQERQVIVLTNQPDDVNLLKKALGEDVPVKLLAKVEPIPIAPPASAPEGESRLTEPGLPLHSSVRRWRAYLIGKLLESPVPSDEARVDAVIAANENDLRVVGAIESLRKEVLKTYRQLDWIDIKGVELGGNEMRDKVREAYDQNRTNPEAFLAAVDQIKGRRAVMVERLRARLEELEFLNARRGPTEDDLFDLAVAGLPEALQYRAQDVVDVFRDYLPY